MRECSAVRDLVIEEGAIEDYRGLSGYHYRSGGCGAWEKIFALKGKGKLGMRLRGKTAGVIVYAMPTAGCEMRRIATGGKFCGFDRVTNLKLLNENVRCISRVIIEPRFRGLGLASRLVRETLPRAGVPIVEAMAVMGHVNPFFEKAGMRAFYGGESIKSTMMKEAFGAVGIEEEELIDAEKVWAKIEAMGEKERRFIERRMAEFLSCYGRRRERIGKERLEFVLSKMTMKPVYYLWKKIATEDTEKNREKTI